MAAASQLIPPPSTAHLGWFKFGGYGIILSAFFFLFGNDTIGGFGCCFGIIAFVIGGIVQAAAQAEVATVATAAGAGIATAGIAQHVSQERIDKTKALGMRAQAIHAEGIDSSQLFKQVAMWMADKGMTPGMLFTELDLDGNESLDGFELREGFDKMGVADLPPWLMGSVIGMVDQDENNEISRSEWVELFNKMGWQANEPSITLSKTNLSPGEEVEVSFTAPPWPPERKAWLGLIPSNIPHGEESVNDLHDVEFSYLEGETEGSIIFEIESPGLWDVRMFDKDDPSAGGVEVASASLTCVAGAVSMDAIGAELPSEEEIPETQEDEHPLAEIISQLPEEHQQAAWTRSAEIEGAISNSATLEQRAQASGLLAGFVDDLVHRVPPEGWATLAALSGAAAGAGVMSAVQAEDQVEVVDEQVPAVIEDPIEIAVEAETEPLSEPEIEPELEMADEETEQQELDLEPAAPEEAELEETGLGLSEDGLGELIAQVESARFMSEREAILAQANEPFSITIDVEKCERSIGFGLPNSHRGGMTVNGTTPSGNDVGIRLPAELVDEVKELNTGSQISCDAIPSSWASGQRRLGLDADGFVRVHR